MKSNEQKALHAALEGPEVQRLKVYGHHWNVKPVNVLRREGSRVTIEGQLDHSVRFWDDDHLYYKLVFKEGVLEEQDMKIEEKGLGEITGIISEAIGKFVDMPIPPDEISKIGNKLENMAHNNWQYAIQKLALRIGLEGYRRMNGVTAYTQPNFKGKYQTFSSGVYNNHDFHIVGNDNIASLRVPDHMNVEVCSDRPGIGECEFYNSDQPKVGIRGISYLCVENLDDPHHILVVDGTSGGRTEYDIEVTDWLSHNAQEGTVNHNDEISREVDDWKKVHGEVNGGKDAYNFSGELKNINLSGDKEGVKVTVDGEPINV